MGAILDIIGSYIFKAAMIGIIIATSINLNEVMVEKNQLTIVEKNLNVAMSIIEWDLKNIGYNHTLSASTPAIIYASPYEIRYYADVQNDGIKEEVRWRYQYVDYDPEVGYRYDLVRWVNGVSYTVVQRLYFDISNSYVSWRFTYLRGNGSDIGWIYKSNYSDYSSIELDYLSQIKGIKVFMKTKSDIKLKGQFLSAEREFTVYPPNLSL